LDELDFLNIAVEGKRQARVLLEGGLENLGITIEIRHTS